MTDWPAVAAAISSATRRPFQIASHIATGGGCINQSYRICGQDGRQFFVKLNAARHLPIPSTWLRAGFTTEAEGLNEITATQTIRVPRPVTHGMCGKQCFLVLEYLELHNRGNARLLGEQLAALHRFTSDRTNVNPHTAEEVKGDHSRPGCFATPCHGRMPAQFGWQQDNFIGTTPQPNGWTDDWVMLWREQRLSFQLDLAARNGHGGKLQTLGEKLLEALPAYFSGYTPQPSLLHGDLWSGNHAFLADGTPVIFDPAPYYGDRECDLAMTELFGGFSADFYAAYRAAYPLDAGYATRKELYNLYHILNHANLFGGSYARQAEGMMQRLLAEIG